LDLILDLSTYSQFLPFIIGVYVYVRKNLNSVVKQFFLIIILASITEILNVILDYSALPNGIAMNCYTFLSCTLFLTLFKKAQTLSQKWFYVAITILCIGSSLILIINKDFQVMDNDLMIFTNYILMSLASITLIKMTNGDIDNLFSQPLFWISATLLIYSTASNIEYSLFPGSDYYINPQLYDQIWCVHAALNILCNILYSYVFICTFKNRFIPLS